MDTLHPPIPWPGFAAERSFVLPLQAVLMSAPFGERCELDGIRLQRKSEFHVTVLSRDMSRVAAAGFGEEPLRTLYGSLEWRPRRTGRYALLHQRRQDDAGPPECWSLIEHLDFGAMLAFRGTLARALGDGFANPVPHVTHYVRGGSNGIGVPDTRALAALFVRDVLP